MKSSRWRWIIWAVVIYFVITIFMQNRGKKAEGDERVVLQVGQVGFTIRDFKYLLSQQSGEEAALNVGERKQKLLDELTQTAVLLQYAGKQEWGADPGLKLSVWQVVADYTHKRIIEDFRQGDQLSQEEIAKVIRSSTDELRSAMKITVHEDLMGLIPFSSSPAAAGAVNAQPVNAELAEGATVLESETDSDGASAALIEDVMQ